jgi:hypothetical protein
MSVPKQKDTIRRGIDTEAPADPDRPDDGIDGVDGSIPPGPGQVVVLEVEPLIGDDDVRVVDAPKSLAQFWCRR